MSREIKFRALVSGTDIWIDDFGFHFTDPQKIFLGESQLMKLPESFAEEHGEFYDDLRYFDTDVIVQYTGLKDKNGVEIYEGDILEYQPEDYDPDESSDRYVVEWRDRGFVAPWLNDRELKYRDNDGLNGMHDDIAIIGNIYENKDLLEKSDAR